MCPHVLDDRKFGVPGRATVGGLPRRISTSRGGSQRHFILVKVLPWAQVSAATRLSFGRMRYFASSVPQLA
jgi:hypothetical protein